MDPDLDPNLQHWQDRADNFQWVVGSLVGLLDSIPLRPDLGTPSDLVLGRIVLALLAS